MHVDLKTGLTDLKTGLTDSKTGLTDSKIRLIPDSKIRLIPDSKIRLVLATSMDPSWLPVWTRPGYQYVPVLPVIPRCTRLLPVHRARATTDEYEPASDNDGFEVSKE